MKTYLYISKQLVAIFISLISMQFYSVYCQNLQDTLDYPWQFTGYSYLNPDTLTDLPENVISDQELLTQTIWVPQSPGGIIPYDLIYIGNEINKLYVYGDRKIIVIDGTSFEILDELYLSDYGSESLIKYDDLFKTKEKHLAWNPDIGMIYCVDDNMQLFLIDPQSDNIIQLPDQSIGLSSFNNTLIKYNDLTHQLFWMITSKQYNYFTKLLVFSTEGQSITKQYELNFHQPFDLEFHPVNPYFYITDNENLYVYDCLTHVEYDNYDLGMTAGEIIVAYSQEYEVDKIFCLPHVLSINTNEDPFALVIDGNSTTEIPLDHFYYTSGIYNPSDNIVFFGYSYDNPLGAGVTLYRADDQYTFLGDHPFEGLLGPFDYVSDFICKGDKTIGATRNQIIFFHNQSFLTDYTYDDKRSAHFFRLCTDNNSNVYVTNVHEASIEIFSSESYNLLSETTTGNASYHGFFNNISNKLYTWNFHDKGNNQLTIYNKTNNTTKIVDIGYWPNGITWNQDMNKIYITNYNSSEIRIKILDCVTNQLDNQGFTIDGRTRCNGIFWAPGNKLYISAEIGMNYHNPVIIIYDLNQNSIVKLIYPYATQLPNGHNSHFLYEPTTNKVFVSLKEWATNKGSIISINNDAGQNFSYTINSLPNVDKIRYNSIDNTLIIRQYNLIPFTTYNSIYLFNLFDGSHVSIPVKDDVNIADIDYDPTRNNIYCTFFDNSGDVFKLDGSSGAFQKRISASGIVNSLKFNPINRNLYIHMILNNVVDRKRNEELLSFNPDDGLLSYISLEQKESPRTYIYAYITDIILDEVNNQIYLTNAQSNIKVIQCTSEQLTLQPRIWNWISFPRLEREGNGTFPSETLLGGIIQFPIPLQMIHLDPEHQQTYDKTYNLTQGWSGNLVNVKSSLGYKIQTQYPEIAELPMTGTILSPETTFPLFDLRPNWTGYYLTETQTPYDAIALEFQDKIGGIQGQYWYCYKEYIHTKNSGYIWRCACSQGSIELKYADMVVIYPTENIDDFHWQYGGQLSPNDPKNPSLFFQYNEQPEYDAIFIELDTMNKPEEIGAFAGDSCIGATTVLPTDTTVLICGYTKGFEGQEITFNLVYPTKSFRPDYDNYYVMNNQTGIREQRRIVAGEKQPYFLVSFNEKSGQVPLEESSWMTCRPNPADNEARVSYFINEDTETNFQLFNSLGSLVKSWKRGYQKAGAYDFRFSTASFPSGYYQLEMNTGNIHYTQKLIIIH